MASEIQDFTFTLDKIPDGGNLKLRVHVKYSWVFKLRFWLGMKLAKMAARLLNMRIETELVEENENALD
jgi:hypothetical protein